MSKDSKKSEDRPGPRGGGADKGAGKGGGKGGGTGAADEKPKRGLNKIPLYLREDLGMPDWLASSVVVIGGGLLMCIVLAILIQIFPG